MKVTFFIFPNSYRASCMPWGKHIQNVNGTFLWRTKSRIFFLLFSKLLHFSLIRYIPIKIYVSDPVEQYTCDNIRYLWWNDEAELPWKPTSKDFFVCKLNSTNHNWLFIKPEISNLAKSQVPLFKNRIVYFGEPGAFDYEIIHSLKAMKKITPEKLQDVFSSMEYKSEIHKQEVDRYIGINLLYEYFENVEIYGSGWKAQFADALPSNYFEKQRRATYRGSICIDFGSKCGIGCLYHRSMEALLYHGILFHKLQEDSYEIFGHDYCQFFVFKDYIEMKSKLEYLLEVNDLTSFHHELLKNTPLAKKNINISSEGCILYEV